jgi:hypothetical protein
MPVNLPSGWNRRFCLALATVLGAWLAAAWGVGPWLVRRAYEEESFEFLNRMISGRNVHPVGFYLDALAAVAWQMTAVVTLTGAAIYVGVLFRIALARGAAPALAWLRGGTIVPRRHLLAWCVGWGLGLGLAETVVVSIRQRVFALPSWSTSGEMLWMAPVAAGMAFGIIGVGFWTMSRWLSGVRSVRVLNLVLEGLAAYALVPPAGSRSGWWPAPGC